MTTKTITLQDIAARAISATDDLEFAALTDDADQAHQQYGAIAALVVLAYVAGMIKPLAGGAVRDAAAALRDARREPAAAIHQKTNAVRSALMAAGMTGE